MPAGKHGPSRCCDEDDDDDDDAAGDGDDEANGLVSHKRDGSHGREGWPMPKGQWASASLGAAFSVAADRVRASTPTARAWDAKGSLGGRGGSSELLLAKGMKGILERIPFPGGVANWQARWKRSLEGSRLSRPAPFRETRVRVCVCLHTANIHGLRSRAPRSCQLQLRKKRVTA